MKVTIKVETKGATVEVTREDSHLSIAVVSALLGLAQYHRDDKLLNVAHGTKRLMANDYGWTVA